MTRWCFCICIVGVHYSIRHCCIGFTYDTVVVTVIFTLAEGHCSFGSSLFALASKLRVLFSVKLKNDDFLFKVRNKKEKKGRERRRRV